MKTKLKNAFNNEMLQAKSAYNNGEYTQAFTHLERAHILGQSYIIPHTLSHWWMCKIGLKTHNYKEVIGQFMRIFASVIFSRLWVPKGNTGGTDVNPFKVMPVPEDLKQYLD